MPSHVGTMAKLPGCTNPGTGILKVLIPKAAKLVTRYTENTMHCTTFNTDSIFLSGIVGVHDITQPSRYFSFSLFSCFGVKSSSYCVLFDSTLQTLSFKPSSGTIRNDVQFLVILSTLLNNFLHQPTAWKCNPVSSMRHYSHDLITSTQHRQSQQE